MMLRGNLATRPFYNERAVQAALTALVIGLGLLSLFTVWQLVSLTSQQRELATRIARDEGRAAELRRDAQQVRSRLDSVRLDATIKATREANAVIDARTFSWTALFNVIERTIPADVRLQAVTPAFEGEALMVRFVVNTRRVEPVGAFMDRLEAAGAFRGLRSIEEQLLDDGSYTVVCAGQYLGPGAPVPPSAAAPTASAPSAAGAN